MRASTFLGDWDPWTPRAWLPDEGDDGPDGFFPGGDPDGAVAAGAFNKMPVMVGTDRDEGIVFVQFFFWWERPVGKQKLIPLYMTMSCSSSTTKQGDLFIAGRPKLAQSV